MGGKWSASRPGSVLPPGKDLRYPLYRRLGGPQSRSWRRCYRKNSFGNAGDRTRSPGRPVCSQTLYWLSYPGFRIISITISFILLKLRSRMYLKCFATIWTCITSGYFILGFLYILSMKSVCCFFLCLYFRLKISSFGLDSRISSLIWSQ
jgi:hypothetical protein